MNIMITVRNYQQETMNRTDFTTAGTLAGVKRVASKRFPRQSETNTERLDWVMVRPGYVVGGGFILNHLPLFYKSMQTSTWR